MEFELRALRREDTPAVSKLFEAAFGRGLDHATYEYFFLKNPFGPPMVELAFYEGRLVAHYGVCPAVSWVRGQKVLSARSMTTMTHPDFEGRGLFTLLATRLYERIHRENGVMMVFGFPNRNSHFGIVHKIGWLDLFPLFFLERIPVTSAQVVPEEDVRILDGRQFLESVRGRTMSAAEIQPFLRDLTFYEWRYLKHPEKKYRYVIVGGGQGAVGVLGDYENQGERHLNVVEALVTDIDGAVALLRGALFLGAQEGYHRVRVWADLRSVLFAAAEKLRFVPVGPITYFGFKPLDKTSEQWGDPRLWRVTMGDSDVF